MNGQDPQQTNPQTNQNQSPKNILPHIATFVVAGVIILAGIYTGFYLALPKGEQPQAVTATQEPGKPPPPAQDTQTFRDKATGVIQKNESGDPYAQGTHKLAREGGPSQTAYLVSSVVDLDTYAGKKVEVWGETFQSTKVGWLMDVGKVNVLE